VAAPAQVGRGGDRSSPNLGSAGLLMPIRRAGSIIGSEMPQGGRSVAPKSSQTVGSHMRVALPADGETLPGVLTAPARSLGTVIFAHGSGSSHRSPRNLGVAEVLARAGFATLLFDFLTAEEAQFRLNVFDVPLLAKRLEAARHWLEGEGFDAPTGYFGASTGAAAALWAASENPAIGAIVSRGGRPDLAEGRLNGVRAPTLLIVGELDPDVLELNQLALARLAGRAELRVVAGAGHLFEEPGALDEVAALARDWFLQHLARPSTARAEAAE